MDNVSRTKKAAELDKSESKHIAVCAIDFGTSFTGVAFSLSKEYQNICILTKSTNRAYGEKIPTIVLLTKDKQFYRFGYEAEEKYIDLCDEGLEEEYYYFNCFKMKLYEKKKLTTDVEISDIRGRKLPAMDIFAMVLKYLVDYTVRICNNQRTGLRLDDFLWVLTVPAIWSDSAKNFMRNAAEKAGIQSSDLMLCLEPEAASLWCNNIKSCKTATVNGPTEFHPLPEGQKYIVVDLGGGTADLSVHEILPERSLKEIRRADGGAFGGNLVDAAFFRLLDDIFGVNAMTHIKETKFGVIMTLKNNFQIKKHMFTSEVDRETETINIDLPTAELKETIEILEDEISYEDKINAAKIRHAGRISFSIGKKLKLDSTVMEGFFEEVVEGVVNIISNMRKDDKLDEINMAMLVGGLSSSPYIQQCIKERVPGLRIFVPYDPSLAVLNGAVLMGHIPKSITEKITRYTYGLSVVRPFRKGKDPVQFRVFRHGKFMCTKRFSKIVEKGTKYIPGDEFGDTTMTHEATNFEGRFSNLLTTVNRSDYTNPEYATEEYGCEIGATIIMPTPKGGWSEVTKFVPKMVLGLSELSVNVYGSNDEKYEAKLEFL